MRCLNTHELATRKVTTIHIMNKILQLKVIYSLDVDKFMYKYNISQLGLHLTIIINVCEYNTTQTKTRQFSLSYACTSNSGAKS